MAFIGNTNTTQAFTPAVDFFSGNGSTTAFTLSRPVASVAQVQVTIDNVAQNPSSAYTVSANTITFTSAPLSGTNNIYVYYTSPITQVIAPGQGTVTATSMASSTGTGAGVFQTSPTITTPVINNITSAASTALTLQSAGTTAITVDTAQKVGIGTTSPNRLLSVYATQPVFQITNVASGNTQGTIQYQVSGSTDFVLDNQGSGSGGVISFTQAGSERMRIDSSGNLLVGQTSFSFGGGICLTKNAADSIAIFQNTYGSGAQCIRAIIGAGANNTSSYLFVGSSASSDRIYIYGNGNVVNSNNSYGTLSDIKLKENIVDASPKLADVLQLKVRNFNLKTDPEHKQIGFIAQELEQVFPALIDNTTSPNDPDDVIKAIKTSVLLPILVKAIQELKTINDTQAETLTQQTEAINALTARIVALEGK